MEGQLYLMQECIEQACPRMPVLFNFERVEQESGVFQRQRFVEWDHI
jgi:hypothetical protein